MTSVSPPKDQAREDERVEKQSLGRFGHHPDASTDFCLEVDALQGWAVDMKAGLRSQWPYWARLSALLRFVRSDAFGNLDEIAQRAKPTVFDLEGAVLTPAARPFPADPVRAALEASFFDRRPQFEGTTPEPSLRMALQSYYGKVFSQDEAASLTERYVAALSVSTPTGKGEGRDPIRLMQIAQAAMAQACLATDEIGLRAYRQTVEAAIHSALRAAGGDIEPAALAHPPQGGERDGPPTPRTVSQETFERVYFALEELIECAGLRGDNELPHPADDPKLWTSRMQEAWSEAQAALDETSEVAAEAAPTSPSESSGEEA